MDFPVIFAHRGANSFAPENSLPAIEKAVELGCDGLEFDIRFTRDQQVVVFHDRNTFRMTGVRKPVYKLNSPDLRHLRLLNGSASQEKIPILQEALEAAGKNVLLNIDVKKETLSHNGFEEKIVEILRDMGFLDNVIISSFNPFVLKKIHALHSGLHQGFIFRNRSSMMMLNGHHVGSLHARYQILSRRTIDALRQRAQKIYAWTVDQQEYMLKIIERGVDGIITNRPEILLAIKERLTTPGQMIPAVGM